MSNSKRNNKKNSIVKDLELVSNPPPTMTDIMGNYMPSNPPMPAGGGDFIGKLLSGDNAGNVADILSNVSSILGNKNGNGSKLRISGRTNGAHIDIELTNLTTLNMALQIINDEIAKMQPVSTS